MSDQEDSTGNEQRNPDETQSVDKSTLPVPPGSDPRQLAARHLRRSGEARPERIGPYKILETLGEGGMGTVYLAEQTKPVHRRVALKIVKLGMDTKQVVARFETEREALAMMNHPGVAKVFDAGVSDEGRSYFVMEYVPGIPITEYCDRHRLSMNDRLQLFMLVCHAVQHAHQKGIIHRDIKPSNVLVAVQDDTAVPKVIDFGVAKATQHRLTEKTLFTEQGQLIGTPEYMSPEQADMTALDVDTRTDIYSLGVLLYELLVGARPFDEQMLREAGFAEIQRIIREVEPPKPSTRLSSLGDRSTQVARKRRTELRSLSRVLRGDLDWIVMKCLEKDRTRRYDTANGLAMEIQRYLSNEPVLAGPPSATYRLRKFVRRNKGPTLAVTVVVLVLAGGVTATGLMYRQAVAERDRAVEAERLTDEALADAESARGDAEAVTSFLTQTLAAVDPGKQGKDVSLREVLDKAASGIADSFIDKPLIEARLRNVIGNSYRSLGLLEAADPHISAAAAIHRRELGPRHPRTLASINLLGALLQNQGKVTGADKTFRRTYEIRRRVLGEEHADTLRSMGNLALALWGQGRYAEAEKLQRRTLEIRRRVLGGEHPDTLSSMNNLALALGDQGRYAEAEKLHRRTLEIQRCVLGEEHPDTLLSMSNLAVALAGQGRYTEAEKLQRRTLEIRRRVLGEEHPDTLKSMGSLAFALGGQDRYAEAEKLQRRTLEIRRRVLGEEHPDTLRSMGNLAIAIRSQDRYAEADAIDRRTLEIKRRVLGEEHPGTLRSMNNLAVALGGQGRYAEAEKLHRRTLEIRRRVLGEEHPNTLSSMNNLAISLHDQGRYTKAEKLRRRTLEIRRRVLGEEHPSTLNSVIGWAETRFALGDPDEAERMYREAIEIGRRTLRSDHPNIGSCLVGLGEVLIGKGDAAEAKQVVNEGLNLLRASLPEDHPDLAASQSVLGECLTALGKYAEAEPLLLESYERLNAVQGESGHETRRALSRIIKLYEALHAAEPDKGYDKKAAEWRERLNQLKDEDAPASIESKPSEN